MNFAVSFNAPALIATLRLLFSIEWGMECLQQLTCSNRLMVVTKNSFSVGQSCRVRDEF